MARGTAGWGRLSYENQRGSLWAIYCIFSGINKVGSRRNCGDWSSKRRHRDVHERGTSAAEARRDKDWVNPLREIDYLPVGRLLGVTFCLRSGKDNAWLTIPWREIWKSWWWKKRWEERVRIKRKKTYGCMTRNVEPGTRLRNGARQRQTKKEPRLSNQQLFDRRHTDMKRKSQKTTDGDRRERTENKKRQ